MSSRSPPRLLATFPFATHDKPSITSARPATVGLSKRLRSATLTPNASRMRETARMATSDCAPSSKKSSWTPTCCTFRSWLQIARSEEHTSELQSHHDLVCRLLLEKKKTPLKA